MAGGSAPGASLVARVLDVLGAFDEHHRELTLTEIAERAIAGLKMTVRDCDQNLSDRLRAGDVLAGELGRQLESGRHILAQLAQITLAARAPHGSAPESQLPHDAQATAQAAAAFAARARPRSPP